MFNYSYDCGEIYKKKTKIHYQINVIAFVKLTDNICVVYN